MSRFFRLYEFRNRLLVLSFMLASAQSAHAGGWDTLPTDKAAHFGLSSVAVESTMKVCAHWEGKQEISGFCRGWSSGLVIAAGILKEVSDKNRGRRFDQQDLVADALGVITGNLLQYNF